MLDNPKLSEEILKRLPVYTPNSKLKQGAIIMLIQMVHEDDLKQIKEQFQLIDEDQDGFLDEDELKKAISNTGLQNLDAKAIIQKVDTSEIGKDQINYTEFIAATLSHSSLLSDQKIRAVYDKIDADKDENLTRDELVEALTRNGVPLTQDELNVILKKHDTDKDG